MSNPSSVSEMPTSMTQQTPPPVSNERKWVVPVVVTALVVGLAGLGVGAYAVATTPAKTSGPQGPVGQTGTIGPQGQQGVPGAKGAAGAAGPAGPAGTLAATSIVASAALKSAPDPAVGSVLVAKTTCPAGKMLLSGARRCLLRASSLTETWNCAPRSPSARRNGRRLPLSLDDSGRESK